MKDSPTITLTGVDEHTDIDSIQSIDAEFGFLFSVTNKGGRYPSGDFTSAATARLSRSAVHICGRSARNELVHGWLDELVSNAQRIQVNGILDFKYVEKVCRMFPDKTIITQHTIENAHLLAIQSDNHALLIDGSGGKGLLPETWRRPSTGKAVGFAGGLGPDNLQNEVKKFAPLAIGEWWVDMESSLRIADRFNVALACEAVLKFHCGLRGI